MGFVNDKQTIIKVLVDPLTVNVLFRATQLGKNCIPERTIRSKLVELLDDAVGGAFEFRTNIRIVPVLRFRFNA